MAPLPTSAQESGPPGGDGRPDGIEVDVLRFDNAEVEETIGDLSANVATQRAEVDAAEAALGEAETVLAAAEEAVVEAEAELDELVAITDAVVIDAFINPPTESALDALNSESAVDASIKQSILNNQANANARKLEELQAVQARLEEEKANREQAALDAAGRKADAEAALADLEAAQDGLAAFVFEIERRLDIRLAEAESLADIDPELAAQLAGRESELVAVLASLQEEAQIRAAREAAERAAVQAAANRSSGIRQPPGGTTTVACPNGGSIEVAGDISGATTRLLRDANAAGISMCGTGFRDPQQQINLRRQHCGASDYAIFQAPSSACSPPTARPGASMHEQALAIDFTCGGGGAVRFGDQCHSWLVANAANYGLFNLPSEPWHWSVNGE